MKKLLILIAVIITALLLTGCPDLMGGSNDTSNNDGNGDNGDGGDGNGGTVAVAAPVFSLEQGQYVGAQSLTLTTETEGATIYYRLDFDTPDTSDEEYSGSITLDATTRVTAVAVKDGVTSEVSSNTYAIREAGYTNQIANGDFSAGTGGWFLWIEPDTSASASWTTEDVDGDGDAELVIEILNGGSESYHVQANAPLGFASKEGELYELSFTAWTETTGSADFAPVTIRVDDGRDDVDGDGQIFESYFYQHEVITNTKKTFTKRISFYVSPNHEHPQTRLAFDLGSEGNAVQQGTIYLDDVSVELVESPESFDTVVTDAAMRTALMPSIHEQGDRDGDAKRFEGVSESEVTAYHVAALDGFYLDDDSFEDAGYTLADFDLSAMDLSYFGALESPNFDEAPVTDSDLVTLGDFTQLRALGLTATDVTDISPLSSMRRLWELELPGNAISATDMAAVLTPETFPDMRELDLNFEEVSLDGGDVDTIVSIFSKFGQAGNRFSKVRLRNIDLADSDFSTLYTDLLQPSSDTLQEVALGGWETTGSITEAILGEIGSLSELTELELIGQELSSLDGLSGLTKLERLDLANNPDLVDFSSLSSMDSLLELDLGHTGFEDEADGEAIAGLTNLEVLNLRGAAVLAPRGENGSVTGEELDGLVSYFQDPDLELFADGGTLELGIMSNAYYDANIDSLEALEDTGIDVEYEVED